MHGRLFIVPLQAYIQKKSPNKQRGSIVAASVFISFCAVLCSAMALFVFGDLLKIKAANSFLAIGFTSLLLAIYILYRIPEYLTRLLAIISSRYFVAIKMPARPRSTLFFCSKVGFFNRLCIVSRYLNIRFVCIRKRRTFLSYFPRISAIEMVYLEEGKLSEQVMQRFYEKSQLGHRFCFFGEVGLDVVKEPIENQSLELIECRVEAGAKKSSLFKKSVTLSFHS